MLRNYLLTAYKVFMRRKLFTAINLACIVLTLVVLMVITSLLETAFFPSGVEGKSERFLQVTTVRLDAPGGPGYGHAISRSPLGYKLIDKYLKPIQGIERVAALTGTNSVSVYSGERISELQMRRVDADYWKVLDFTLLAGRLPNADDDTGARNVVVLNQSTARKLFPGPVTAAVGRPIDIGGRAYQVIGVVEDVMQLNAFSDIWAPIATFDSSAYRNQETGPFTALLLAHKAADLPRVRRDVERIARGVVLDDPKKWGSAHFWADSKLDTFARGLYGNDMQAESGAARLLATIGGAMLLFMLLPALNLVNLNTGRIIERRAEIGLRKAMGATSRQLAAQLLVENLLLCLAGGVLGLAATAVVLNWLENLQLIPYLKVQMDLAVFAYGMLIAAVFGLLSGVIPAWNMSRLDPAHALKGAA
jgi:putative ABC transport system permease protein